MKNRLLITTALVALVSAGNAYADALNIADGDTHKITANETVDSLEMTGGSLTGAADVEASVNVSGDANISGGLYPLMEIMMKIPDNTLKLVEMPAFQEMKQK